MTADPSESPDKERVPTLLVACAYLCGVFGLLMAVVTLYVTTAAQPYDWSWLLFQILFWISAFFAGCVIVGGLIFRVRNPIHTADDDY